MNQQEQAKWEARAMVMKSMAHPSRLMIVDALSKGPKTVSELTEMIGCDMSTVSRHLSVLKNAGVLADQRQGTQINYHLRTPCVLNFFACVESVLQSNVQEQIMLAK